MINYIDLIYFTHNKWLDNTARFIIERYKHEKTAEPAQIFLFKHNSNIKCCKSYRSFNTFELKEEESSCTSNNSINQTCHNRN